MLGSRVKLDRCGVCGGDGTSCVVCNGTVMRRTMRMSELQEMVSETPTPNVLLMS